jgi:hypothetical protein
MVEEIKKKLASLGRWTMQLSRTGATAQRANRTEESGEFRG